jgi:hypothetical protein
MLSITPREAIQRLNESVSVEMLVQRTKSCTGSLQYFLDSEANHHDPNNLGVVVTTAGVAKLKEAGIENPAAYFKGKSIHVQGVVILRENRPYIEVDDPDQIQIAR